MPRCQECRHDRPRCTGVTGSHDPSGARHVPASHTHHLPGRRVPQSRLGLAHVPVLVASTACRTTGTSSTSARARRRRGRGDRRGERRRARRAASARTTPGIWSDEHVAAFRRITAFLQRARRRAGHPARARRPQGVRRRALARRQAARGRRSAAGSPSAPSAVPFDDGWLVPRELDARRDRRRRRGVRARPPGARSRPASGCSRSTPRTATCCTSSSRRSPTSAATRYGGDFAGRTRLAARGRRRPCAPPGRPSCRCSCASPPPTGSRAAGRSTTRSRSPRCSAPLGVDLVDCSSGGNVAGAADPARPGLPGAVRRGDPRARRHRDRAPSA